MKERRSPPVLTFGFYALFLFALLPYDAYRWGDGLEFTAVASCFGVAHPTGYPLFSLLGWLALKLPVGVPYIRMLILCRLAMFAGVIGVQELTRIVLAEAKAPVTFANLTPRLAALAFGFSHLALSNSTAVEVYALNTALIVWIAVLLWKAWFDDEGMVRRYLGCASILLGLAASHHLTALCVAPAFIGILTAQYARRRDSLLFLTLLPAAVIPLVLYGTLPLRFDATSHGVYWSAPDSIAKLIDMLRGGEYRQYQFLMQGPATPFTAQTYIPFFQQRILLFLQMSGSIVLGVGPTSPLGGVIFAALGLTGMVSLLRRRVAVIPIIGFIVAQLLLMAFILTYNIPDIADYFMGIQVLLIPFAAYGLWVGGAMWLGQLHFTGWKSERALIALMAVLALLATFANLRMMSRRTSDIEGAWRDRFLEAMPKGAALITGGDMDLYTVWYEQFAEGRRTDIFAYGGNFQRFPWFRMTLPPEDPRREAVTFKAGPPPLSAYQYIQRVENSGIDPLLARGRVFTTFVQPLELQLLTNDYQLIPRAQLLTDKELEVLVESGAMGIGAPVLYEITRREEPKSPP